nr:MAG TPA: hypothetical protein [Caudoviricetes sp.]
MHAVLPPSGEYPPDQGLLSVLFFIHFFVTSLACIACSSSAFRRISSRSRTTERTFFHPFFCHLLSLHPYLYSAVSPKTD